MPLCLAGCVDTYILLVQAACLLHWWWRTEAKLAIVSHFLLGPASLCAPPVVADRSESGHCFFGRFFYFTASVRSRKPGPTLVVNTYIIVDLEYRVYGHLTKRLSIWLRWGSDYKNT